MGKYLIKVTEEYRADSEAEADEILNAARQEEDMYEIKKSTKTKKQAKAKGEIVDEWFNVSITKIFDSEKEPIGSARILYDLKGDSAF